jgi:hypothetical protein
MSLAYTMFNVYLPTLLEARSQRAGKGGGEDGVGVGVGEGNYIDTLWEMVLYALGGCPGALVCLWLFRLQAATTLTNLYASLGHI